MNWITTFFSSSVGRKIIMALTGLFLCVFLVIHMLGNMQLLNHDGGKAFNEYAELMGHNPLIQLISKVNFVLILFHIIDGLMLTMRNRAARPSKYAVTPKSSTWASRNMALMGIFILVFLVVHLKSFWFESKFGSLPTVSYEGHSYKDLYSITVAAFADWWYVAIYVVGLAALAFHLVHGFQSAFQTLGINHSKYTPAIKIVGYAFALIIPLLFASQPIILFLRHQGIF